MFVSKAEAILKKYWGYENLKPNQLDAISATCERKQDVLAFLPTGSGKSLIYQIPPLLESNVCLVLSPLVALIDDQVSALKLIGISAVALHSQNTNKEDHSGAWTGAFSLIYMTPERFMRSLDKIQEMWRKKILGRIAVDEGHILSETNNSFRPEYRELSMIKKTCPGIPIIVLTATLTDCIKNDIVSQLCLEDYHFVSSSSDRPLITYSVMEKKSIAENITLDVLGTEPVLIYCNKKADCDEIGKYVQNTLNVSCGVYHAGMSPEHRADIYDKFMRNEIRVTVCTSAFGLGVNKPDVRLVICFGMPKTMESAVQFFGRSSRDGLASTCIVFFNSKEISKGRFFAKQDQVDNRNAENSFKAVEKFCTTTACRRRIILDYFGESVLPKTCGNCDNCLNQNTKSTFTTSKKDLPKYTVEIICNEKELQLFELLKMWRLNNSKKEKIAPYMIFSDRTLKELCVKRPLKMEQLPAVFGIGQSKIIKFGKSLLQAIQEGCDRLIFPSPTVVSNIGKSSSSNIQYTKPLENSTVQKANNALSKNLKRSFPSSAESETSTTSAICTIENGNGNAKKQTSSLQETMKLIEKGFPVSHICEERKLKESTILSHILDFLKSYPKEKIDWTLLSIPHQFESKITTILREKPTATVLEVLEKSGFLNPEQLDWKQMTLCRILKEKINRM